MAEMDSDEAFARALQKQLLEEAEGSNLAAQHSNYGAQSHGHGQDLIAIPGQKPPPSYSEETPQWDRESSDNNYRYGGEESLQQLLSRSEEEDSDLLLARRMQQMVDIGTYDSQQFASLAEELRQQQQSHTTSNNDNFETQPLKSRREQEEEDARLARRLMESGMSFRDLECVPGSTTPAPKPKPPPTTTTDRQSSGDSGTGYRDIQLNSGHTSNAGLPLLLGELLPPLLPGIHIQLPMNTLLLEGLPLQETRNRILPHMFHRNQNSILQWDVRDICRSTSTIYSTSCSSIQSSDSPKSRHSSNQYPTTTRRAFYSNWSANEKSSATTWWYNSHWRYTC